MKAGLLGRLFPFDINKADLRSQHQLTNRTKTCLNILKVSGAYRFVEVWARVGSNKTRGRFMEEENQLTNRSQKTILFAFAVFGLTILILSLGFAYFSSLDPDKEGLDADFAALEEEYGITGCEFEISWLKIFVKDEVWDSMDKNKKYQYMGEVARIAKNRLWDRHYLEYPKKPSHYYFYTSVGIVADAPTGDAMYEVYR